MTRKIYELNEIKEILKEVFRNTYVKKAILFGSYAKNLGNSKSDIDLVIDTDGKHLDLSFYGILEDLTQNFKKNIDLFEITEIEKGSKIHDAIKKEGVVVYEK